MPLEPVHVMEMDRSTSRLELVRINPTRQFLMTTGSGTGIVTWQNGHWYGAGGQEIPISDVPEACKQAIADSPPTAGSPGAAVVTATCRLCGETMNSGDMEAHLLRHIDDTMRQAGTTKPEPKPPRS